jgi:type I restriction-modification system DNA methylase subunit
MPKNGNEGTTANLGFEAKLWAAADALRNNMDAAEYKHVVLGLIFLKYISDELESASRPEHPSQEMPIGRREHRRAEVRVLVEGDRRMSG